MNSPVLPRLRPALAALLLSLGLGSLGSPVFSAPAPNPPDKLTEVSPPPKATIETNVIPLADNPKAVVDEVWQLVNQEFVDKNFDRTAWLAKRRDLLGRDYRNNTEAYRTIAKILKDLEDPYTRFLPPQEFAILTSQTSGEVSGVGIRILLDKRSSDLVVADVLRGTPAMEAGIQPGDRIVRIDGKPTALMGLDQATEAIQGEIGTELNLQLSRPKKGVFSVTLTRQNIELDSVTYSIKEEGELRVGYIRLDEFSSHAAEQMEAAINELNQAKITGFVM
ncbi:MAG: carboxyl-terminal protease, partial [Cyanobacteriota bacterium]